MNLVEFLEKHLKLENVDDTEDWVNAMCPTHEERKRSFGVHKRTLTAKCYVCGKQSLASLLQAVKGVTKVEALNLIRKELGKQYTDTAGSSSRLGRRSDRKFKSKILRSLEEELTYYTGQYAKYMTKELGFTKEVLREFKIFYNDEDRRVLFPVFEEGRLVGMMYRNNFKEGDYWYNEKFDRQKYVYNIDNVNRGSVVTIVESPKDVAWMKQAGIDNVVSVFGTNFGKVQVKKIKAVTNKVRFAMDNDKGGYLANKELFKAFIGCVKYHVDLAPFGDPGDMDVKTLQHYFKKLQICFRVR